VPAAIEEPLRKKKRAERVRSSTVRGGMNIIGIQSNPKAKEIKEYSFSIKRQAVKKRCSGRSNLQ